MKNYRSFRGEFNKHNWNVMFNVLKVARPNFLGISGFLLKMVLTLSKTHRLIPRKMLVGKLCCFCKNVSFQLTFVHMFHVSWLQNGLEIKMCFLQLC